MMPTARRTTRRTLTGPDALTLSRVPLAVAIACVAFGLEPPARPVLVTLLVAAIRLASLGVTRARFRVVSIAHTLGNKTTGLVIAAVALGALASGHLDDWCVATACGVAVLAALEELIMATTTRVYSRDRRGWWDDNHIASS